MNGDHRERVGCNLEIHALLQFDGLIDGCDGLSIVVVLSIGSTRERALGSDRLQTLETGEVEVSGLGLGLTKVADLLDGHFAFLTSLEDREDAVGTFQDYDLFALPVVDSDGILLGIVTVDDILDVAEEEATEDFHKMASVGTIQVSLKDATIGILFRKRIGWLLGLVIVNVFTAMGIKGFQTTIEKVAVLVSFMPLLIGSGGNAGSQAATLLVRAMAIGDIDAKDWFRLFLRSMGGSLLIGAVMAAAIAIMSAFILAGDPNRWQIMGVPFITFSCFSLKQNTCMRTRFLFSAPSDGATFITLASAVIASPGRTGAMKLTSISPLSIQSLPKVRIISS